MGKSTSRYLEVERKFDVVESTVSPSFDGLSAVSRVERSPSHQLDAVYFDTPGRDLAARSVTLRRRTGGPDAGWHLKLPAGPDARTEVREPLGSAAEDEVPEALRDVVLAIVRDRPLAPVARISTNRTVDVLRSAGRHSPCRILRRPGDRPGRTGRRGTTVARMGAGARRRAAIATCWSGWPTGCSMPARCPPGTVPSWPGCSTRHRRTEPPEPPDDPIHRAVAEQVEELLVWDRAVRADVYDSVHQMRVTTRKIRSLLQSSEDAFGISDDAWILDELRQLAAVLGVARDAEVLAERYEKALEELPVDLVRGPVWERLVDGAKRRYASGLRRSLIAMRSQRYFRLLDALEGLVATEPPPAQPGEEGRGPVTIESAYKKIRKAAKAAAGAEEAGKDEALHRIRKGAKRLRYTAAATGADEVSVSRQDHPVVAGRSPGQRGEPNPPEQAGRGSTRRSVRTPSPTGCSISWRTTWHAGRATNSSPR